MTLEQSVGEHGLELVWVPADGNCQFHAVSHQLTSRFPDRCPSDVYTHEYVRKSLAVAGVRNMTEEHQDTFRGELIGDKRNKLDENASFKTCLDELGEDGTWGNHTSLLAVVNQLRDQVFESPVKIIVYNTSGDPMPVTSWGDGQDPAEDTVVTLNLALQGEEHYYSTVALGDGGETNKRRREDDDGGKNGSKRVSRDVGDEKSFGSSDSKMMSSDDAGGDDEEDGHGNGEDGPSDAQEKTGKNAKGGSPDPKFIPPTPKSGKLYCSIPLSVFSGECDDKGERVFAVTQTGRSAGLWTMRPNGDGVFRLFPLLEGRTPGESYVSKLSPPSRTKGKKSTNARSLQGHNARVLHVNLDIVKHTVAGPTNGTVSLPLLRSISKRSKKDNGEEIDGIVWKRCAEETIKSCHEVLAFEHDSGQLPFADSDRGLADSAARDHSAIEDRGDDTDEETADLERRRNSRNQGDQDGVTWTYRKVLHEGGRRWLLHSLLSSFPEGTKSDLGQAVVDCPWDHSGRLVDFFSRTDGCSGDTELAFRSMCPRPGRPADDLCERILRSIGDTASGFRISSRHLMGEALELFSAMSIEQKKGTGDLAVPWVLRDYIRGDQNPTGSVECRVERCFISAAPQGSPFRMSDDDREELGRAIHAQAQSTEEVSAALANKLFDHMKRDHGYDALVWLKEMAGSSEESQSRSHFLLIQCKARSDPEAKVEAEKYIAATSELQLLATEAGCLAPLYWCSNVIYDSFARYELTVSTGRVIPWFLPDICGDNSVHDLLRRVGLAVVRMGTDWARPEAEDILPPRLRPHQVAAVADLRAARGRRVRCGVANKATGSGKTYTACEDTLRAEAENEKICKRPSLCTAPGIDLVLQVAGEWWSWEHRRKQRGGCPAPTNNEHVTDTEREERDAWIAAGQVPCRSFYYVVCSASEHEVASAHLRVIRVAELPGTLKRHQDDGTLHLCRFFTTIEGGGSFWYQSRKFNLERGKDPMDPVFGVFARDEVHRMCGVNSSPYSLGLNVPAIWMPSYTATPMTEESRTEMIRRTMKAGEKSAAAGGEEGEQDVDSMDEVEEVTGDDEDEDDNEEDGDNDEDIAYEEDGDEDEEDIAYEEDVAYEEDDDNDDVEARGQPSKRHRRMNTSAVDLFPQVHSPGMADGLRDTALEKAVERRGLHGIQLLPRSLLFEDLEQVAERNAAFSEVSRAIRELGSYLTVSAFHGELEKRLKKSVAIFAVVPSASGKDGMYDVDYCFVGRRIRVLHTPTEKITVDALTDGSCVVLGLHNPPDGPEVFSCVEYTNDNPPMGAAVHDCTSFSPDTNLVGPILARFSFAECFASDSLAKPGLALSDRGLLRVPPGLLTDGVQDLLRSWAGVTTGDDGKGGIGVSIEDPRKVFLSASVGPGGREGRDLNVVASAHDFHCMNHLLDLFVCTEGDHGVKAITKAIVFCENSKVARRCMAVFRALVRLRSDRLRSSEQDQDRAGVYESITSAHVFQSDESAKGLKQSYEVRRKLIWRFRGAERAVLFNTNLLSTGVDLPCCDCVYLQCPSTNTNVVLQRWGRALRRTSNPEKVGLLALPCTNPYEPDEDQREEWRRIGLDEDEGIDRDQRGAFYSKYDLTCRLVECAIDPRNLVLGRLISVVTGGAQAVASDARGVGRNEDLESFLKLMISRRGDARRAIMHVSNADLSLLQKCTRVVGGILVDPITEAEKLEALERFLQDFRKEPTNNDHGRVVKIVRSTGEEIPINVTSFYDHTCRGYKQGEELAKTLIDTKIRPLAEKYVQKPNGRYAWQKKGLLLPDNILEEALEIWKEDQRKYNAINLHEKAGRELKISRPPTEYLVVLKSGQKVDIGRELDTSLSVYPRMNQRWNNMKERRAIYVARFKLFCRVLKLESDEQKYPPLGWAWWDAVKQTKSAKPDGYADWLSICRKWKEHEPPQSYRLPLFTEVLKLREIDRCQSSEGGSFLTGKVPIGKWFFEEFLPVLPSDSNNKGYALLDPIDRGYVDKIREVFFGADYWGPKRKAPNATLELLRGELSRWKPWNIMVYQRRGEDVQLWPSSAEKAFILDKGKLEGRVVNIGSMYNNLTRKTKPDDKNTKIREEIDSIVGMKIQWGRDPRPKKNESKNRKKVQKTRPHSITHEEYLLGFRKRFETLRGKGKKFKRIPSHHDKSTETYDIESPGNNKVIRISDKDLGNYARLVRDGRNLEQMRDIASSAKLEVDTKDYFEFFLGQQTPEDWKAAFEMRAKELGPDSGYEAKVPKRMRNPAGSIKSYRIEKPVEFPFYRLFTENQLGQHVEWVIGQEKKEKKEGGMSSASDLAKWMGLTDDEMAEFKRRYSL